MSPDLRGARKLPARGDLRYHVRGRVRLGSARKRRWGGLRSFPGNIVSGSSSNIAAGTQVGADRTDGTISFDDADLVRRCREGDLAAFGSLIRKYQDRIYNAILRMCRNRDDAEELSQETFVRALENIAGFRQASGVYTWLFRIAVNLTISRRRRRGRVKFHSLEADLDEGVSGRRARDLLPDRTGVEPSDAMARSDVSRRVLEALEELDEEFRVVAVLRDVEDMNYQQISEVLEIPVGTVKSRLYRARKMLCDSLRDLVMQ